MATKLKSWTRHWLAKVVAVLLILSSGLVFVNTLYEGRDSTLFDFDYQSAKGQDDLESTYQQLMEFLPGALAHPEDPSAFLASNLPPERIKNYHYAILVDGKLFTSNLEGLTSPEDFYIITEGYLERQGPTENVTVLLGQKRGIASQLANEWHEAWMKRHALTLFLLAGCLLLMISGMVYLAAVAGRRPGSGDLHFMSPDRVFTDVFLALWLGFQTVLFFVATELLRFSQREWQMLLKPIGGLFLVLSGAGLLYAWMLFWKRLKSRTLLSHTLTWWGLRKCVQVAVTPLRLAYAKLRRGPVDRMPLMITTGFLILNVFTILFGVFVSTTFGAPGFLFGGGVYLSGIALIGLFLIRQDQGLECIETRLAAIQEGQLGLAPLSEVGMPRHKSIAEKINGIAVGYQTALETALKSERMKTELITNVSHDLKTPLTSILNYIDLLKRAGLNAPEAPGYLEILDQKSQRLKTLTEDLFEAAKASSGSLGVQAAPLSLQEFLQQSAGEIRDRMSEAGLALKLMLPEQDEPLMILADGRHLWRIMENLFLNVLKYTMPGSRVYLELEAQGHQAVITLKNISALPLEGAVAHWTERFVRGDAARSTEGSGLGLAIAKSLAELQNGAFEIETDGDLFKAILRLPLVE